MKFALLFLVTLLGCSQKSDELPKVSRYTVLKPTGSKNHAIFQIKTKNNGGCTAFVVSKNTAITAGHCVDIAASLLNNEKALKNEIHVVSAFIEALSEEIQIVAGECELLRPFNRFKCLREIQEAKHEISEKKDYLQRLKLKQPDTFKTFNSEGKELAVIPVAVDRDLTFRDFAVLSGDFSNFETLEVSKDLDISQGDVLRSCGFAALKFPATCTNLVAQGNAAFAYAGNGYLVKGMSGGPVIDSEGKVVGINVAVTNELVIMTPIIGILNSIKE